MADAQNAPEGFHVEMDQFAGSRALIALNDGTRLELRQAIEADAGEDRGDGRARHLELRGNRPGGAPFVTRRDDRGRRWPAPCAAAARCGATRRSSSAGRPPRRCLRSHL